MPCKNLQTRINLRANRLGHAQNNSTRQGPPKIAQTADDHHEYIEQVERVLDEIGAGDIPRLEVFNKIDNLPGMAPRVDWLENPEQKETAVARVWVSAQDGAGFDLLHETLAQALAQDIIHTQFVVTPMQGRLRAKLYEAGAVIAEHQSEQGQMSLEVKMPQSDLQRLLAAESMTEQDLNIDLAPQ